MVEHTCEKCGKIFTHKSTYINHLNRKNPCKKQQPRQDKMDALIAKLEEVIEDNKLLKKEMQPKKEKKKEIVVKQEKKEFKDVSIDIVTEEGTKPMKILVKETKKAVKVEEVSDEDLMQISNGPIY